MTHSAEELFDWVGLDGEDEKPVDVWRPVP